MFFVFYDTETTGTSTAFDQILQFAAVRTNADLDEMARRLEAFHKGSWWQRAEIADALEDSRLRWLARRLIFAECPQALVNEHRSSIAKETAQRMLADQTASAGWTTLAQAEADLEGLLAELPGDAAGAFEQFGSYLRGLKLEMRRFA